MRASPSTLYFPSPIKETTDLAGILFEASMKLGVR
jgi:hypothetical protein